MDIWVLGCGPSLAEVCIPPDVFTIGTNNSYKQHWSPVWAGSDARAIRRDYAVEAENRPLMWFSAIDPKRISLKPTPGRPIEFIQRPERPSLRKAGVFAYWLACHVFHATRVHLLGFDMETAPTHFDSDKKADWSYASQRFQMKEIQQKYGVESWVFITGSFMPLEKLPSTGRRVRKGQKIYDFATEKDVTEGLALLPQDFWKRKDEEVNSLP